MDSRLLGDQFVFRAAVHSEILRGKSRVQPVEDQGKIGLWVDPAGVMVFAER